MRKGFTTLVCMVGLLVSTLGQGQAASITTTFSSDNGASGNMFDITTFENSLTVNSLELNLETFGGLHNINVYTKSGTYVGYENNATPWLLVSQLFGVSSSGQDSPTIVDVADFTLLANSVTGFFVTTVNTSGMSYTNGNNTFANSDLRLDLGVGRGTGLFAGRTFSPRTWNGTINYTVDGNGSVGAVPEPSTILLMGTGITGLALWRSRRVKSTKK